jgi:hypothetical protein
MRFEQSFLASVRGFIHEVEGEAAEEMKEERQWQEENHNGSTEKPKEKHSAPRVMTATSPRGEPELWVGRLRIEWCVFFVASIACP